MGYLFRYVGVLVLAGARSHSTHHRPDRFVGPTQPPIQWVTGTLTLGAKGPGREADRSLPTSVEVKKYMNLYIHSPLVAMA
jgi:hypothetical protein